MQQILIILITFIFLTSCSTKYNAQVHLKKNTFDTNILKIIEQQDNVEKMIGTAFVFQAEEKRYIITAAHNVNTQGFDNKKIKNKKIKVKIGKEMILFDIDNYIILSAGIDVAILESREFDDFVQKNNFEFYIKNYCNEIYTDDDIVSYYYIDDDRFSNLLKANFLIQDSNILEYNYLADRLVSFGSSGGVVLKHKDSNYCLVGMINSIFKSKININTYINGGALTKGKVIYDELLKKDMYYLLPPSSFSKSENTYKNKNIK